MTTLDTDANASEEPRAPIEIHVDTDWMKDHKANKQDKYAFAYHITITNCGEDTVQLLNRYWLITDGNGKQTEVAGPGVVGETPILAAGESFGYSSGAILDTPIGFMQGHYEFCRNDDSRFKVPIEVFTLSVPNTVN